jgi:hypothetical protein
VTESTLVADDLDETIEETFPASDAPANTPETGILIDPTADVSPPDPSKKDGTPQPGLPRTANLKVRTTPG